MSKNENQSKESSTEHEETLLGIMKGVFNSLEPEVLSKEQTSKQKDELFEKAYNMIYSDECDSVVMISMSKKDDVNAIIESICNNDYTLGRLIAYLTKESSIKTLVDGHIRSDYAGSTARLKNFVNGMRSFETSEEAPFMTPLAAFTGMKKNSMR